MRPIMAATFSPTTHNSLLPGMQPHVSMRLITCGRTFAGYATAHVGPSIVSRIIQ